MDLALLNICDTGYFQNWRKFETLIYCKHNESFIKQGQDAPLSNSNFLLEIRIPSNLDGNFAPHSLELVSINRFFKWLTTFVDAAFLYICRAVMSERGILF